MPSRPFDVIIFGASGFTGEYVVENLFKYLSKNHSSLKWAAAGRSESKVKASLSAIGTKIGANLDNVPVKVATVGDDDSLVNLAKETQLLINCTGPFRFYGEPVVKACVDSSTHYVDITGEPEFMEKVQLKYHDQAQSAHCYIVPGCGFDSIPCDLGVNFIKDQFGGVLDSVETYLAGIGSLTGNSTTWDCAVEGFASVRALAQVRRQLYSKLFDEPSKIRSKFGVSRKTFFRYSDEYVSGYGIPFAGADRSVVKRSQMHNYLVYDEKNMVQMEAYMIQSLLKTSAWLGMGAWISLFSRWEWGRSLLRSCPSFFSFGLFKKGGPSEEEVQAGNFAITFKGRGWANAKDAQKDTPKDEITTRVEGPHPGYPACAICVNQAALTLLEELDSLPDQGGVFTPATAFRKTSLINRLNENGLKFYVVNE